MERAGRVGVVPVDMGWSDVGSWDVVLETAETDPQGNAIRGPVDAQAVSGSLLYSDGPRLIVLDVDDLIVVATAEGVLVTRTGSAHALKQLVEGKPKA
jgi:mannose-1-phosphate guanylyltransferase/mannose-1-phosphate guanylyltransferase/mannose-6-phosphate isomerase